MGRTRRTGDTSRFPFRNCERNPLARVLSRGWLLVLISVLATLLVPTGTAAAADHMLPLASPGPSATAQYLQPLVEALGGSGIPQHARLHDVD